MDGYREMTGLAGEKHRSAKPVEWLSPIATVWLFDDGRPRVTQDSPRAGISFASRACERLALHPH